MDLEPRQDQSSFPEQGPTHEEEERNELVVPIEDLSRTQSAESETNTGNSEAESVDLDVPIA